MLYRSQKRDAEARQVLEGVVTANRVAGAEEYWIVVRTFARLGDEEKRASADPAASTRQRPSAGVCARAAVQVGSGAPEWRRR
jgi:hypothetical protein